MIHPVHCMNTPADSMENHLGREEIREALAKGYGESTRYSSTLLERQIYTAKLLPDGTVIRLSETHYSVLSLILMMTQPIAIVAVIAAVLSLILASRLSEKIIKPLNELNIDKNDITVIPTSQPYSSYIYIIDDEYKKRVTKLFK